MEEKHDAQTRETEKKAKQMKETKESKESKEPKKYRPTFIYTFVMCLYAILAKLVFFMRIEGRENIPKGKSVVLMGNHQCLLDPLTLALCARDREIHFMGKKELFGNRAFAWVLRKVHAFPVDRGNIDMGGVRTAMGVLRDGDTLGIFPEGTRSRTGHMLPLLGGASLIALKSGCDVVPVYIDGRYKPFRRMKVIIGESVPMDDLRAGRMGKESVDTLTARIEASFGKLSGGKSLPPAGD